jgi:adenosylhomocysteine nucleosidase
VFFLLCSAHSLSVWFSSYYRCRYFENEMNKVVVIISANAEWRAVRDLFPAAEVQSSPFGEWFCFTLSSSPDPIRFFHGGWGKIAAAASAQYVIDRWQPSLLINLGTCGGFEGSVERGEILLVERTLVYDLIEQMGDSDAVIAHYITDLDLSWLGEDYPLEVRRTLLVSADRDLLSAEIPRLKAQYGAVAGDWESGAIAWVARRNGLPCLILRGVTDLVGEGGGEAYGNIAVFHENTAIIMRRLVESLPGWLALAPT